MERTLRRLGVAVAVACCYGATAISAPRRAQTAAASGLVQTDTPGGGSAQAKGPENAPVTIVVFSDFESEVCGRMAVVLQELLRLYPDQVRVVFKHDPQEDHPNAALAHQAALAAAEQGKFWEMHDIIFANQDRIQRGDLSAMAAQIGLDVERFEADRDGGRFEAAIDLDREEAGRMRVAEVPTVFVNGRKLAGARTLAELRRVVDRDLQSRP